MNRIITIGREFGSGGREFGRRLAEELNIEYYDKEIISGISQHTSLSEEYVKQVVECVPHNLYPITVAHSFTYVEDSVFKQIQSVYKAQSDIIKAMAEKSDCVIVGRCADYILKDLNPYRIFVYANINSRLNRCRSRSNETEHYSDKQLIKRIKKIDKNRAKYYEFYTGNKWGDKSSYDLCLNTSDIDIKGAVKAIAKIF